VSYRCKVNMPRIKLCARKTIGCKAPHNQLVPTKTVCKSAPTTCGVKNTQRHFTIALREFGRIRRRIKHFMFRLRLNNITRVAKKFDLARTHPYYIVTKFCSMAICRGSLYAKTIAYANRHNRPKHYRRKMRLQGSS
jgi:hypothetical protein